MNQFHLVFWFEGDKFCLPLIEHKPIFYTHPDTEISRTFCLRYASIFPFGFIQDKRGYHLQNKASANCVVGTSYQLLLSTNHQIRHQRTSDLDVLRIQDPSTGCLVFLITSNFVPLTARNKCRHLSSHFTHCWSAPVTPIVLPTINVTECFVLSNSTLSPIIQQSLIDQDIQSSLSHKLINHTVV